MGWPACRWDGTADVQSGRASGEWKKGTLKRLNFEPHAELRMRQRNITEAEVREALAQPEDQHFYNPKHGRMNVRHHFPGIGMTIVVGYEERTDEIVVVTVIDKE